MSDYSRIGKTRTNQCSTEKIVLNNHSSVPITPNYRSPLKSFKSLVTSQEKILVGMEGPPTNGLKRATGEASCGNDKLFELVSTVLERVNCKKPRISVDLNAQPVSRFSHTFVDTPEGRIQALTLAADAIYKDGESAYLAFRKYETDTCQELDHDLAAQFFREIAKLDNEDLNTHIVRAINCGFVKLRAALQAHRKPDQLVEAKFVWPCLITILIPFLMEPEYHSSLEDMCLFANSLGPELKDDLDWHLDRFPQSHFADVVELLKHFLTVAYMSSFDANAMARGAVEFLDILFESNERVRRVPHSAFYNDVMNGEDFDIKLDYYKWKRGRDQFTFCNYPFVYDPSSKSYILQYEARKVKEKLYHESFLRTIMTAGRDDDPALTFVVRRDHIIQDAVAKINAIGNSKNLLKPLKIKFVGEPGVDEGGVQKEFFQLVVKEIFSPQYGLFYEKEDLRRFWFNPSLCEAEKEFELIGCVIGLAIFHGHILDFRLPNVIFKKLLEKPTGLEDLAEIDPSLAKGLKDLLQFEGDVENVFMRSFEATVEDGFGDVTLVELKEGGAEIPVTSENKKEYVDLCVDFSLNKSILKQFGPFKRGFDRICKNTSLFKFFQPEELELLVCGSPVFDFHALEKTAKYEDGYTAESQTIKDFWKIVHDFTLEEKKKLLRFTTGSDKVPIKGLGDLPFVISRNGPDSDKLPTAHVCFNHLLLPQYSNYEKMKNRLSLAINNAEGFGLR